MTDINFRRFITFFQVHWMKYGWYAHLVKKNAENHLNHVQESANLLGVNVHAHKVDLEEILKENVFSVMILSQKFNVIW